MEKKSWIFTFGFGQGHDNGYVEVFAEDRSRARDRMFEVFGNRWGFQYDSEDAAGVHRFGLHKVATVGV